MSDQAPWPDQENTQPGTPRGAEHNHPAGSPAPVGSAPALEAPAPGSSGAPVAPERADGTPPTWPGNSHGGYGQGPRGYGYGGYDDGGYGAGGYGAGGYGVGGYGQGPSSYGYGGGYGQPPYGHPPLQEQYGAQSPAGGPGGHQKGRALRSAAAILVVVAAAAAGAGVSRVAWPAASATSNAAPSGRSGTSPSAPATTVPGSTVPGSTGPANVSAIAAKVDPALVDVNVAFGYNNAEGAGTGIVLSPNGLVLTNNHVIDESTKVSVVDIGNARSYPATVLGYDSTVDVALLKLQGASGLSTAQISSTPATVGQPVVAVGNAGGTGGVPSSTGGSVIALDQSITASDQLTHTSENLKGMIETDASIQPGDSGGPLVNTSSQVLAMDTAALSSFAFSQAGTQGYSIPISRALRIAKDIEAGRGTATVHVGATAWMGLQLCSPSTYCPPPTSSASSSTTQAANPTGLQVYDALTGLPASQAGLSYGDVLTSFDGTHLNSFAQLSHLMVRYHPGDKVRLGWLTPKGQSESATITLASGPPA